MHAEAGSSAGSSRPLARGASVLLAVLAVAAILAVSTAAQAAVTVSRAELNGSRLRIEGRAAANRTITVDGVAMGTSDGSGSFRIERDGFAAPADCTVDVNDGSATPATARLSGCTVTAPQTPTTVQTTSFTVQVRDQSGNTARKSFSITINPPRPLVITNASDQLAPGRVGVSYATGVFADGGVPPYRWSLAAGQLPPGLSLTTSPGRITGTPTSPGTFTFTLRVTDDRGQQATRQFSIKVSP